MSYKLLVLTDTKGHMAPQSLSTNSLLSVMVINFY